MSRITLISAFATLLAACGIQSADAIRTNQGAWAQDSLACADLGIDPGSVIFSQCVADLHNSLWAAENRYEN